MSSRKITYSFGIFCLIIAFIYTIISQVQEEVPVEKEKPSAPVSKRVVVDLSGKWDRSENESDWTQITLPYPEEENNKVIYKKVFKIEDDVSKFAWQLQFLGVDDRIDVFINDKILESRSFYGSLAPFTLQVPTSFLTSGNNTIKLVVHPSSGNIKKVKEQYTKAKKIYTGVLREIYLIKSPLVYVNDIKYKLNPSRDLSSFDVKATVLISSGDLPKSGSISSDSNDTKLSKSTFQIETIIRRKNTGETVLRSSEQTVEIAPKRTIPVEFAFNVGSPNLWSPENPNLYEISARISKNDQVIDELTANMGFVDVSVQTEGGAKYLFINNKATKIKGVDYVEDFSSVTQPLNENKMEQEIKTIKDLGANLVCFKYSVPHPTFLSLCDKYGLMALIELPLYNAPNSLAGSEEIIDRMKIIADRMVLTYDNHPSVVAWGIGNGIINGSAESDEYNKEMIKSFRAHSSKLIYKIGYIGADVSTEGIDLLGLKEFKPSQNYLELKDRILNSTSQIKNVPVFLSYGMAIQPENHGGYSDPLSVEAQANYLLNVFHITEEIRLAGSVIWSYNDYELQNPDLSLDNDDLYLCSSGMVDRNRQPRLSFNAVKASYNNEKEPLLSAGSYSDKSPVIFIILGILTALLIVILLQSQRRFREYFLRSLLRPYNFYADIRDQRIISTIHTFGLGLFISISFALLFASILYFYRCSYTANYLFMLILPQYFIRELFFKLMWMPELMTLFFTVIFFGSTFIIASIIKLFSFFVRSKIFFRETYIITVWSATPIVLLLLLGIVLNKIMVSFPNSFVIIALVCLFIFIWTIIRIIRATAVVFDIRTVRAYTVGFSFIFLGMIIVLVVYNMQYSFYSYLYYLVSIILRS